MRRAPLLASVMSCAALLSAADEDYSVTAPINQRPMLGVEMSPVPTNIQDREGLDAHQGVLVQATYQDTAAAAMGLHKDDVILAINGQPITSMTDLRNEVGLTSVGDSIEVQVSRNGQLVDTSSTVKPWPAQIPYDKLDSAAEKRFRDWQDRRQQRLADDVERMTRDAEAVRKKLAGEADPTAAKGRDNGTGTEGSDLFAFRLRYLMDAKRLPDGVAPSEAELGPLAALPKPSVDGPWRLRVALKTPAGTPAASGAPAASAPVQP